MTYESYGFVLSLLIPVIYFGRTSCQMLVPVGRNKQRALCFTEKVGSSGETLNHILIYLRDEQRIRTYKLTLKCGKALQRLRISGGYLSNVLSAHLTSLR